MQPGEQHLFNCAIAPSAPMSTEILFHFAKSNEHLPPGSNFTYTSQNTHALACIFILFMS